MRSCHEGLSSCTASLLLSLLFGAADASRKRVQMDKVDLIVDVDGTNATAEDSFRPSLPEDPAAVLKQHFGIGVGRKCHSSGEQANHGCALGCECGWGKQCYKKGLSMATS